LSHARHSIDSRLSGPGFPRVETARERLFLGLGLAAETAKGNGGVEFPAHKDTSYPFWSE
jgi:hypothetical protein